MGIVLKAALDETAADGWLGAALGLIFALGLSSKYLYLPLAIIGRVVFREAGGHPPPLGWSASFRFFLINRILNPLVFTSGYHWLVSLATHKGIYGEGGAGLYRLQPVLAEYGEIITASPVIRGVPDRRCWRRWCERDQRPLAGPDQLTLVACLLAFAAEMVATSKHFDLHYMMASWVLTGGFSCLR